MPPDDDAEVSLTDLAGLLLPDPKGDNEDGGAPGGEGQPARSTPEEPDDDTPAEGTGEGEGEGEGDGPQEVAEGDEPSTEPFYTVKIDGKLERVTLKEALDGYQRHADYTRKTEEISAARKAVEVEQAQARGKRDQYEQVLGVILERLGPENSELNAEQWNTLRQSDPAGYAVQWTDFQRRENQRNAVKAEQARIADEKRGEALGSVRTFIDGQRQKLIKALPVLADPEKGPAEMKAMREYAAKTFNFTDQELDQAYDHRMLLMLDKARKWDTHQAALAKAKGKIEAAPQVSAPGARQIKPTTSAQAKKIAQDKFNRSGDIDDAVPLLLMRR